MLCPSCGAEHDPAGGAFCAACGLWVGRATAAPAAAPSPAADEDGQPCPECGVRTTATSCRQCGARMPSTDQDDEAAAERRRRRLLRERERAAAAAAAAAPPDAPPADAEAAAELAPLEGLETTPDGAAALEPGDPTPEDPSLQPPTSSLQPPTSSLQPPTSSLQPPTSSLPDRDAAIEAELAAYMGEPEPPAPDDEVVVFAPVPRDE